MTPKRATFDAHIITAATTTPTRAERAGMIVMILLALAIVVMLARPAKPPVCAPVTPGLTEEAGR